MRTINADSRTPPPADPTSDLIQTVVDELHSMIGSLRCAGTGRMVKAGISMTHLHILWVLEHHGELTMSRLAEMLDVSFSNATGLIDRMEALKQDRIRAILGRLQPDQLSRILVAVGDLQGAVIDEIGTDHLEAHV